MTAKESTRPVSPLALTPRWRTADTSLHMLLVIHSVTAATRIADTLPALHDPRVQLYCTQTSGAVFANGVEEYIRESGILHIPWEQAREMEFDLVITASLGDNLHEIKSRILRIPHGNGYNKQWNQEPGTRNQEPGTRNQEPGTRNQEPGTRNQEPGTRNQEPGGLRALRGHSQARGTPGPQLHRTVPPRTVRPAPRRLSRRAPARLSRR